MTSPLSRNDIEAEIANALAAYDDEVRAAWTRMRIEPEQWRCRARPHKPRSFWVVALVEDRALWFNDVEDGFNWSRFSTRGTLDEYFCDQASFAEVLEQIAQQQSDAMRARLRESGVPPDLRGAGAITFRQTTYWNVIAASGATYRIHFRDREESVFADPTYQSVDVFDAHPLLVQYDEPSRSLFFVGAPLRSHGVSLDVERAIRDASGAWRGLHDYDSSTDAVERSLRGGHGMLMKAPVSICSVVAQVLEATGVRCSILGSESGLPGKRVLLLGRSYVVASGFAFEEIGRGSQLP